MEGVKGPPVNFSFSFSFLSSSSSRLLLPSLLPVNSRERKRRGAGAPVMERPRRRWPSVFPSDTHPGKWSPSEGVRGGGRNGDGRSLARPIWEVAVVA
uniref:Uncharacterized protein n=1 Tax=Oryza glumipatula TaxID=40148 RepID=A0A0D9YQL1_9ORYZ